MFNLRKKVLGKLPWLQIGLRTIFLRDKQGKFGFRRYSLEQQGWFWLVFPRLVLVEHETLNLLDASAEATKAAARALDTHANAVREEVRAAVKRSATQRAGRARNVFDERVQALVLGTEKLPSAVVAEGRSAISSVYRSMVEATGEISQTRFEEAVEKSLAQMIVYARKEAGAGAGDKERALPVGTRFVYYGDPLTAYVIEEAPRVRTIRWDRQTLRLSFPYVVFVLTLERGRYKNFQSFFRNEPLALTDDRLYFPPLPDLNKVDCSLCFPAPKLSRGEPSDIAESAQLSFWSSSFSTGHQNQHVENAAKRIQGFSTKRWKELSEGRPLDVLKIDWLPSSFTVAEIGKKVTSPATALDANRAISKLQRLSNELAREVALAVKEGVVEAISDEKKVAHARKAFDESIETVLRDASIATQVGDLIRSEITSACEEEKIADAIDGVGKRASAKVAEIISSAMDVAVMSLATYLEKTNLKEEGGGT